VVTEAEIVIDNDVVLDGQNNLIVDGGERHRVFFVEIVTAELNRLTVTGGSAYGVEWERRQGGGIYNTGFLTLTDCTVSGNTAEQYGGGIYNRWRDVFPPYNSTLTIHDSTVTGNMAEFGGGIRNSAAFTIVNSTVSSNTASQDGGGIASTHSATMLDSTVSENMAGRHGGGIAGGLDVLGSVVSGNTAESGAGISVGSSTIVNSTVSGNTASLRGGGIFNGIYGEPTLIQVSIWGNAAPAGPGIFSDGKPGPSQSKASSSLAPRSHPPPTGGGTVTIIGSLVQGDCHIESPAEHISRGYNIESPGNTCSFDEGTDQVNVSAEDLHLGPLADNGGPTMTHALGESSVAIDVIPGAECLDADGQPLTTDQRGEPRDSMCDVGAFEVKP
jgi:predicted outer membrane repeat protein